MLKAYLATATASAATIYFTGYAAAGSTISDGSVESMVVDNRYEPTDYVEGVSVVADVVDTDAVLTLTFGEAAVAGVSLKPLADYDSDTSEWVIQTDGLQITLGDAAEPCFTVPAGIKNDYYFNVWDECAGTASSITFTMPLIDADTIAAFGIKSLILHDTAEPYTFLFKGPWTEEAEYGVACKEDMTADPEFDELEYHIEFTATSGDDGLTISQTCDSGDLYMSDFLTTTTTEEGVLPDAVAVEGTDFNMVEWTDGSGYNTLYFFLFSDQPATEIQKEALLDYQHGYAATQYGCYDITAGFGILYADGQINTDMAASEEECNKLAFLGGYLYSGHQFGYTIDADYYYCYYFEELPEFADTTEDGDNCMQISGTGLEIEEEVEEEEEEEELSATKVAASAASMLLASATLF